VNVAAPATTERPPETDWKLVVDESIERLGLRVLKSPLRSPKANSICERAIGTLRRECLDWLIPLSEAHLRQTLKSWVAHYNRDVLTQPWVQASPILPPIYGCHCRIGGIASATSARFMPKKYSQDGIMSTRWRAREQMDPAENRPEEFFAHHSAISPMPKNLSFGERDS